MDAKRVQLLCLLCCVARVGCIFTDVIQIEQGKLRGLRSVSGQNKYYSIPYATANRFQTPQPPLKWDGIFDAVIPFRSCAQAVSFIRAGSENCLELDVFSPEHATPAAKLPVLVYIHGGAYYYGAKWNYDPEFLVTKNVVVVIINYRLGVFGFLCTNTTANLGLKDQLAALQWVRKNIAAFGGDPDNVTLSGQSAGAASAAMHILSRASSGLFHKAILLSGSPLAPWSFNVEPSTAALQDAQKIRPLEEYETPLDIFSTSTLTDILNTTNDTSINPKYFKYAPCIDVNFTEPFFHDTPYETITSGNFNKVPIISGFANVEGILFYGLHDDKTLQEWDETFLEKLPAVFSWCSANKMVIAEKLRAHYFAATDGRISKAALREVVNFYSDLLIYSTTDSFARLIANYSGMPIYKYIFAYDGERNFAKALFGSGTKSKGASHSDDVFYIFKPVGLSLLLSSKDKLFIDRVTTMVTNFMKFGDPTPRETVLLPRRWPPSTSERSVSMLLDSSPRPIPTPNNYTAPFFRDLLCTYGLQGHVPCRSQMKCEKPNES